MTDMSINTPWSELSLWRIIIKWAEEEIGKNSVIPWIMAIKNMKGKHYLRYNPSYEAKL